MSETKETLWNVDKVKARVNELVESGAPDPKVIVWFSPNKAGVEIKTGEASEFHSIAIKSVAEFRKVEGTAFKAGEYLEFVGKVYTTQDIAAKFCTTTDAINKLSRDGIIKAVIAGKKGSAAKYDDTAIDALFAHFSNGLV